MNYKWHSRAVRELYSRYVKQARNRNLFFNLSKDFFTSLVLADECHYCKQPPFQVTYGVFVLGIDRKDNSMGYIQENSVPCCKNCNYSKRGMPYEDFLKKISNG